MLYFFMVAHKAGWETLSKAFLKSMKTWQRSCWHWRYFSQRILRLKICSVVLLPALKRASSSAIIVSAFGFYLLNMIFTITLLGWLIVRWFWYCCMLPFLRSVLTKNWVHRVGHFPVCQILLQIIVRTVVTSSPPAWTSSAWMLSTQADFPFFSVCTAASTSLRRMGWSSSVSVWGQSSTDGSPLALWLYSSVQYSVHRFSISCSSVRHFPKRSWTVVAFPCFTVVKSFMRWYALLLLFFLRFSSISLHCSPVQFSFTLFHGSLDVVVHFPVFLRSFRFKSFLSQFSPSVAQIKNFCSDSGFFLLTMFAMDLNGCFSHCCVEVVIIESRSVYSLFMMVRGVNFPLIIAWQVFNTIGFSFSRSNLNLVCFGSLILFRRRWKVIRNSWPLPMSASEKLRVRALFTSDRKRFFTKM